MNGIINVYKEQDFTSFDVVAKLRRILHFKRIGHTGTLDPMATGVLPICVGKSTKVVDMLTDRKKTYKATIRFGLATDTQDITGEVLEEDDTPVTKEALEEALAKFVGDYDQVPPMYSAVRHNGRHLYELAREGVIVERKARRVHIFDISQIEASGDREFSFEVTCSKGTYIRTLIVDVASDLNTVATMSALERTMVEPYSIEDAVTLDDIEKLVQENRLDEVFQTVESLFTDLDEIHVKEEEHKWLYNGNHFDVPYDGKVFEIGERVKVFDAFGHFVAIYEAKSKDNKVVLKPHKMFYP